jgi:nanoRNase/pAp phosphatase (c-di-AMP/oligoRNAs hydrolase)
MFYENRQYPRTDTASFLVFFMKTENILTVLQKIVKILIDTKRVIYQMKDMFHNTILSLENEVIYAYQIDKYIYLWGFSIQC